MPANFYLPYLSLAPRGARPPAADGGPVRLSLRSIALTFEPEELAAVADAAARVRELGDPLLAEHAESAMRKLACDLPVDAAAPASTRIAPAARAGRRRDRSRP